MDFSARPARKQGGGGGVGPSKEGNVNDGNFNIWHGKRTRRDEKEAKAASTRCKPNLDCGYTRARRGDAICVFFAQGRCTNGPECDYLHKLPDEDDEKTLGPAVDIFGRERFGAERQDMGGIGSFSRENRTLYVGRVVGSRGGLLDAVKQQFGEFGSIESCRVLEGKNCAFVKYRLRASAEFAKEAMACQSISRGDPPINLRWATEDPNPGVRKREHAALEDRAAAHLQAQGVCLRPADFNYPMHYQLPPSDPASAVPPSYSSPGAAPSQPGKKGVVADYPDTSQQFSHGSASAAPVRPPPPPPGRPGSGWVRYFTAEGYPYFYNAHTQVTAWELPAGQTLGAENTSGDGGGGGAEANIFETDPAVYSTEDCTPAVSVAEGGTESPGGGAAESAQDGLLGLAEYGESEEEES